MGHLLTQVVQSKVSLNKIGNCFQYYFLLQALLGYGTDAEKANWFCGGSVLSERFVLTAGHCTSTRDNDEVQLVRTAMLKRTDRLDPNRLYRVASIIKHPQYNAPNKYNDIALLRTDTDIRLDQFVVPICLPIGSSMNDLRASAIGFGLTKYKGSNADNLQKVTITKFTTSECSDFFPSDRNMLDGFRENTQLCYGDKEKSKDTCQGDSGGPLQVLNEHVHCMYTVVGVTSFGRACGFVGEPGIYTRVSAYTPWIESVVWPN
ncbi:Serine protease snake [Eumeta japonica]|uniref:Serine protease snake n=1 Tax=Eumeta variegata TaxID=151549 RepID=A0A4C1T7U3_EUMVA|nr:Serine protease snake [Eumeta japonica]